MTNIQHLELAVGDVLWLEDAFMTTSGWLLYSKRYRVYNIRPEYVPGVLAYELENIETCVRGMVVTQEYVDKHGKRLEVIFEACC